MVKELLAWGANCHIVTRSGQHVLDVVSGDVRVVLERWVDEQLKREDLFPLEPQHTLCSAAKKGEWDQVQLTAQTRNCSPLKNAHPNTLPGALPIAPPDAPRLASASLGRRCRACLTRRHTSSICSQMGAGLCCTMQHRVPSHRL